MVSSQTGKEVRFSSKTENIAIVERLIDEVVDTFNIKEDHYGNILIALTEAVNNAIVHGNKLDPAKEVVVRYAADGSILRFFIEDEGAGFDYDNLPDPTSPENREKPNGRGVFLMRNLADDCAFHDDGRLVELMFESLN